MRTIESTSMDRRADSMILTRDARRDLDEGTVAHAVRGIASVVFFSSIALFVVVALGAIWGAIVEQEFVWRVLASAGVLLAASGMTLGVLRQLEPRSRRD